ncbi:hypothetical protein [Nocardioides lianchengensis]|uniref:Uncharacterized protein n=1 Tax=Nocardioides lianchengensis TaxID=1045774 RepID=A0A1G6YHF4_9ACTN|nr:hypothetical protein [Nocardioides lianchengensis]NYG09642.1 hypothetical protein [Nocardioides lianchengensis]SDD89829.1 hypothetical protein SAMN05421872_11251 [Nocardioides lianchengensis]
MVIEYADAELVSFVEHFQHRVLQDALSQATAGHWIRRAEEFEGAKPVLGGTHGDATPAELGAKWRELDAIARACRGRAQVSLLGGALEVTDDVQQALDIARVVA